MLSAESAQSCQTKSTNQQSRKREWRFASTTDNSKIKDSGNRARKPKFTGSSKRDGGMNVKKINSELNATTYDLQETISQRRYVCWHVYEECDNWNRFRTTDLTHIHVYVNVWIHMHENSVNHMVGFLFSIAQLLVRLLLATVLHSFFLHNKSSRSAKLKWKYEKQNGRNETYRASIFVESDKYKSILE